MLRWMTPHELVTEPNPIFDFELRRIRRYKSPESLRRFSVITLVALNVFIALLFFAVFTYFQNQYYASIASGSSNYPGYNYGGYTLFQWIRPFSTALSGLSFAVSMGATLFYIAITAGSLNRQMDAGHWDLLRLTNLPRDEIIAANYAAAQIRAWRIMAIDRTIAVATALLPLLQTVTMFAMFGTFGRGGPGPNPFFINLLTIGLNLLIAFIIPAWRMRAFTAIGLAASARIRGTTFAFLAALAVGFVVEALTLLFSSSTRGLLFQVGFRVRGFFAFNLAYPIMVFLGTVVIFSVLQLTAISFARHAAFRQE